MPWLTDRKWAHIRVEGQAFGDVPLDLELKLEVWDSPNSAGIVIDAVRCCKLALNHGIGGQLDGPSSYLMKSPQNQRPDEIARQDTEKFIAKYAGKSLAGRAIKAKPAAKAARKPAARKPAAKKPAAPSSRPQLTTARPGGRRRHRPSILRMGMTESLAIAHVTHPWGTARGQPPHRAGVHRARRPRPPRRHRRAVGLPELVRATRA